MNRKISQRLATALAGFAAFVTFLPSSWAGAKYRVIYDFQGGTDGLYPSAALAMGSAENFYGVTSGGGDTNACPPVGGCGTVFELEHVGGGWSHKVLYRFRGLPADGAFPYANLALDKNGNLYGTTQEGGDGRCSSTGCGIVFELTPASGGRWKETVLHSFSGGDDGAYPYAGVILDAKGNVYGTTGDGGTGSACQDEGCGTVFELTPEGGGTWKKAVLYSFSYSDGGAPTGIIFDAAGSFYGLTEVGGTYGDGVAYELSPAPGGDWKGSVLYDFYGPWGAGPCGGPMFYGRDLYAAAIAGGEYGDGVALELKPGSGGNWAEALLHDFSGKRDGYYPCGPFVLSKTGDLYGVTDGDGSGGTIFELAPQAGGKWRFQVAHVFPGGQGGRCPPR